MPPGGQPQARLLVEQCPAAVAGQARRRQHGGAHRSPCRDLTGYRHSSATRTRPSSPQRRRRRPRASRLRCGGPAPRGSRRRATGPGAAAACRPGPARCPPAPDRPPSARRSAGAARCLPICSRQPGFAVTTTSGLHRADVRRLAVAQLRRRVRHDDVVDAGRAAADRRLGDVDDLEVRDRAQHRPGLGAHLLAVPEVAGVVVGHAGADRVPRGPGPERRRAPRARRGPWR